MMPLGPPDGSTVEVMCGLGVLVGFVDCRLLRGVENKVVDSCAPRRPH